jgi:ABC-2 type transport system permease protein
MWSIVHKEYRQRARGVATVGLIITYTLILGGVSFLVYLAAYASLSTGDTTASAVGKSMCISTFIAQMLLALMLSLSINASSIAAEKDQETFDLLNLTLFKSYEIVLGKFLSSTGFLLILVVTAIPIYTLAFTFGGVSLDFFWRLAAVVIGSTLLISAIGLLLSLTSEDLRTALGRAFLAVILLGAVTGLFGSFLVGSLNSSPPPFPVYWLGALSWLINPIFSAIDVLSGLKSSWPTPQPEVVPAMLKTGVWLWAAIAQTIFAVMILAVTSMLYPRYRASRTGGVA